MIFLDQKLAMSSLCAVYYATQPTPSSGLEPRCWNVICVDTWFCPSLGIVKGKKLPYPTSWSFPGPGWSSDSCWRDPKSRYPGFSAACLGRLPSCRTLGGLAEAAAALA